MVVYHLPPGRLPEDISIICPKILYRLPEGQKSVSFARSILCHLPEGHLPARIARHTLKSSSLKIGFYYKGQK